MNTLVELAEEISRIIKGSDVFKHQFNVLREYYGGSGSRESTSLLDEIEPTSTSWYWGVSSSGHPVAILPGSVVCGQNKNNGQCPLYICEQQDRGGLIKQGCAVLDVKNVLAAVWGFCRRITDDPDDMKVIMLKMEAFLKKKGLELSADDIRTFGVPTAKAIKSRIFNPLSVISEYYGGVPLLQFQSIGDIEFPLDYEDFIRDPRAANSQFFVFLYITKYGWPVVCIFRHLVSKIARTVYLTVITEEQELEKDTIDILTLLFPTKTKLTVKKGFDTSAKIVAEAFDTIDRHNVYSRDNKLYPVDEKAFANLDVPALIKFLKKMGGKFTAADVPKSPRDIRKPKP